MEQSTSSIYQVTDAGVATQLAGSTATDIGVGVYDRTVYIVSKTD